MRMCNRFFGVVAGAIVLIAALSGMAAAQNAPPPQQSKIGVIAVQRFTTAEAIQTMPAITYEIAYLNAQGYEPWMIAGTVDNIRLALLEPRVKAISFFGHGGPDESTLAGIGASSWRSGFRIFLMQRFMKEGKSPDEASRLADRRSANFGLELVRNASCYSLVDTAIADLFVRPGGRYFGVGKYLVACPTAESILSSQVDFMLTEYRPPVASGPQDCTKFPYCGRFAPEPDRR